MDVFDAGPARPREGLRTRLAGAHVAHSGFVPGVAHFGRRAAFRPLLRNEKEKRPFVKVVERTQTETKGVRDSAGERRCWAGPLTG